MKKLNPKSFNQARHFLKTQARPLDRALFEHRFESAPAATVLSELAPFQNADGGFGGALEPDLRSPSSSALATGIGLRLLKEVGCSSDHPMVHRAVDYLLATFDPQNHVWRVAPHDVNEHPHAGWWHDEGGSLARTFDGFRVIPRAELVGLLHHYASLVPAAWLTDLTERTIADVETLETLGTGGGDTLVYALSLAQTPELPKSFQERLSARVRSVVPQAVSRDPREWGGYCITPLKIAPSPASIVADLLGDALQMHLDDQIDRQTPEGTWDPVWSWGDAYPAAWEEAKREWRGHLTLETLTTLRAFGRLEN
jgi:hypothetical protein